MPVRVQDGMDSQDDSEQEGDQEGYSDSRDEVQDEDFVEYASKAFSAREMDVLSKGWTAFVVGVVAPSQ